MIKVILKNIEKGNYIDNALELVKKINLIKKEQKIIQKGLIERLKNGSNISSYLSLLEQKNKEKLKLEYEKEIKEALTIRL